MAASGGHSGFGKGGRGFANDEIGMGDSEAVGQKVAQLGLLPADDKVPGRERVRRGIAPVSDAGVSWTAS